MARIAPPQIRPFRKIPNIRYSQPDVSQERRASIAAVGALGIGHWVLGIGHCSAISKALAMKKYLKVCFKSQTLSSFLVDLRGNRYPACMDIIKTNKTNLN